MHKVITFGEVMLRLATPGFQRFGQATGFEASFGGGEANVAVSLANYGIDASFVSILPDNDLSLACISELRGLGVGTKHIKFAGNRMGIYFLESGAVSRAGKVIYDRAGSSFASIKKGDLDWNQILEGVTWFHWTGITPAVSEGAAVVCLEALIEAEKRGITISCDLNYRAKLWRWGKKAHEIMPQLVKYCDVVLGNEEDAEMALNIKPEGVDVSKGHVDADAYKSVSKQIMQNFQKIKKVITTLRSSISASHNNWSGVIWDGEKLYKAKEYNITHIVDRVGGGDSFMGGLIYGLLEFNDNQKALDFATAASALKHTITGDYNRVTVDEVIKLMKGDGSGRVTR